MRKGSKKREVTKEVRRGMHERKQKEKTREESKGSNIRGAKKRKAKNGSKIKEAMKENLI